MERIASFCVDHTRMLPGMYLSRQDGADGEILTWDIRMKQPNKPFRQLVAWRKICRKADSFRFCKYC